jgi:3-deoxy-D-manno-octulosonate 8-phosphate phosphatase (KDO 8-P phosphatase)
LPDPAVIARARQAAMQTLPGQNAGEMPPVEYSHPSDAPIPPEALAPRHTKGVSRAQWSKVKLLALDVDGVLTDGGLTFDENGQLLQTFHVRDGFALVAARRAGLVIAWISGRASRVAEQRFKELDLHHCILACADKSQALSELQNQYGFAPENCCFVGDDLPDLPAFARSGVRVAVADAVEEVKSRADYVTQANGGRGAVREVIELILSAQGHWDALMSRFTVVDVAQGSVENYQR